jgi:hypothetical protein
MLPSTTHAGTPHSMKSMTLPLGIVFPTGVVIPMLVGRCSNFVLAAAAAAKGEPVPLELLEAELEAGLLEAELPEAVVAEDEHAATASEPTPIRAMPSTRLRLAPIMSSLTHRGSP